VPITFFYKKRSLKVNLNSGDVRLVPTLLLLLPGDELWLDRLIPEQLIQAMNGHVPISGTAAS